MLPAVDMRRLICDRYDDRSALAFARHAAGCYEDSDGYAIPCYEGGWDRALLIEEGATQVGIASCPWAIVISPRGSSQLMDWREDLRSVWRRPASRVFGRSDIAGTFGWGFGSQVGRVWPRIGGWVERELRRHPEALLYVACHSLGVAVGVGLLDLLYFHVGPDRIGGGYLFESPRPGDRAYAEGWDARHPNVQSVVHVIAGSRDVVNSLPPRWTGARHVCRGRLTEIYAQAADVARWRVGTRLLNGLRAHYMSRVIPTLERRLRAAGAHHHA